jgi:hypothetical protein
VYHSFFPCFSIYFQKIKIPKKCHFKATQQISGHFILFFYSLAYFIHIYKFSKIKNQKKKSIKQKHLVSMTIIEEGVSD